MQLGQHSAMGSYGFGARNQCSCADRMLANSASQQCTDTRAYVARTSRRPTESCFGIRSSSLSECTIQAVCALLFLGSPMDVYDGSYVPLHAATAPCIGASTLALPTSIRVETAQHLGDRIQTAMPRRSSVGSERNLSHRQAMIIQYVPSFAQILRYLDKRPRE